MKNILITGGAGFIGSHLALRLRKRNHIVTVLDNLNPQSHGKEPEKSVLYRSIAKEVRFIQGDVTSIDDMRAAISGHHTVVHLAAETGTGQSMYKVDHYVRVNIGGTSVLLDLLSNTTTEVERIVIASSRAIYGEGKYVSKELGTVYPTHRSSADMINGDFEVKYQGCVLPLSAAATEEDSKIHPSSVYGITKQTQEQLIMTVCPGIGIKPVALRYQNVYGPGQSLSNPYTGILSIFSNLIMRRKPINVFEDGNESRDFVYIDDVVEATVLAIEKEEAAGQIFNVGTGKAVSVLNVAQTLLRKLNGESPISVTGNFRVGDIRHNFACLKKIRRELGFEPVYDLEKGLSRFCDWALSVGPVENRYEDSLREMTSKGLLK